MEPESDSESEQSTRKRTRRTRNTRKRSPSGHPARPSRKRQQPRVIGRAASPEPTGRRPRRNNEKGETVPNQIAETWVGHIVTTPFKVRNEYRAFKGKVISFKHTLNGNMFKVQFSDGDIEEFFKEELLIYSEADNDLNRTTFLSAAGKSIQVRLEPPPPIEREDARRIRYATNESRLQRASDSLLIGKVTK